jgi:NADH-quinone oxidoreductase subunit G
VAADPVGDGLASAEALRAAGFVLVQELFLTETAKAADVVLPAAAWAEREGTYTSGERRVQRFYPALPARGRPDFQIAAALGERLGLKLPQFASLVFQEIAQSVPAYAGLSYPALAQAERQFPDVGGRGLYYGGTSYTNEQGLGVQLKSGAERGQPVTPHAVDVPHVAAAGLRLVPIAVLYDRGTTFAPSRLMHPRVPAPHVLLNPADAARLEVQAGEEIELAGAAFSLTVAARLDGRVPEGAALLPESLGPGAPLSPVAVMVNKLASAVGGR